MFGVGPLEWMIVTTVLFIGGLAALGSRSTKLVLQKLVAHEAASDEAASVIELVGRQQGLISFLLTIVGISPITDLRVTSEEICCNSTSLFGRQNQSVPLRVVCSVAGGVRKPVSYLFVGFVFAVIGVFGSLGVLWNDGLDKFLLTVLVCGGLAGFFIWMYAINKRFFVSIYTQGGPPILLSIKPNVIEGVPLDLERALQIVKILRDLIVASTVPAPASAAVATAVAVAQPYAAVAPSPNGHQAWPPAFETEQPGPGSNSQPASSAATFEYDDHVVNAVVEQPDTLLQQARDFIKQGRRQDAIVVLRDILQRFPRSAEAGVARSTLEKAGISV